jgi:seryl-tRNA synthetase
MIDIQTLRKDPEAVAKRLATRGPGTFDLNRFQQLESTRKQLQTAVEQAQASKNRIAKDIGTAKGKGHDVAPLLEEAEKLKALLERSEQQLAVLQQEVQDFLRRVPNIPHESVPLGASSDDNREERRWSPGGSGPRKFDFAVKDHVDLGERLGGIDFATGAKVAGSRFVVMRGQVARLHRALAQFMLDTHTSEHGYTEVYAPYMVSAECADGVSSLSKFKDDPLQGRGPRPVSHPDRRVSGDQLRPGRNP